MGRKSKYSFETKLAAVNAYKNNEGSMRVIAKRFYTSESNFKRWWMIYNSQGESGLLTAAKNKRWDKVTKLNAVLDYLNGQGSLQDICKKYKISSNSILKSWIKVYNDSHKELKSTGSGGNRRMTNGRKTTFDERVEIVQYCISHGKDYGATIEKYNVSYQQIYSWVKKYEAKGIDGLIDKRGKTKPEAELTDMDRLKAEMKMLEAKNIELEMENRLLKKIGGNREEVDLSGIRQLSKYIAVKELHAEYGYPIRKMCAKLCIAASSYYKWLKRKPSKRQLENEDLTDKIKDMFYENDCVLGVRRMTGYINRKYNTKYTHKRIRRLMRMSGLYSVIRRQRHSCTVRSPKEQAAENILNRDFKADNINEKWLTDVSEFKYGTGNKAYLSAILDLGDNSIVAWVLGHSNNNQLVFETFNAAVAARPDAHPLFHSDRGFQYTSPVFVRKLQEAGMTRSMSRVGKCIDNDPMEGFWSIIKTEMYYLNHFDTYEELKAAIAKYMYHYNNTRYQEKLGFLSPMEYQSKLLAA